MKIFLPSTCFIVPTSEISTLRSFPQVAYSEDDAISVLKELNSKFSTPNYFSIVSFTDMEKMIRKNDFVEYIYGERID